MKDTKLSSLKKQLLSLNSEMDLLDWSIIDERELWSLGDYIKYLPRIKKNIDVVPLITELKRSLNSIKEMNKKIRQIVKEKEKEYRKLDNKIYKLEQAGEYGLEKK